MAIPEMPAELQAHIERELELKAEIEELIGVLERTEYRTKTEKAYFSDMLQAKRRELNEHLGIEK